MTLTFGAREEYRVAERILVRYLIRLLPYMRPYAGRVVTTWVCVFASGAFVMASPVLVRQAIN